MRHRRLLIQALAEAPDTRLQSVGFVPVDLARRLALMKPMSD
jgi:hypothetical protein